MSLVNFPRNNSVQLPFPEVKNEEPTIDSESRSSISSCSESEKPIGVIDGDELQMGMFEDGVKIDGYLMLAGYGDFFERGQIKAEPLPTQGSVRAMMIEGVLSDAPNANVVACIPVVNLFMGIFHVLEGLISDGSQYGVSHMKWQFKVMRAGIGLLEITLVGGWLVHGIATIYFKSTEPALNYTL